MSILKLKFVHQLTDYSNLSTVWFGTVQVVCVCVCVCDTGMWSMLAHCIALSMVDGNHSSMGPNIKVCKLD